MLWISIFYRLKYTTNDDATNDTMHDLFSSTTLITLMSNAVWFTGLFRLLLDF